MSTLRNLRMAPRPYDHETEHDVWVALTPLEWSVIIAAVQRCGLDAAHDPLRRITDQVRATQRARIVAAQEGA